MRILVTGSSGHLGEALMRTLADGPHEAVGLDLLASPYTTRAGSICDADFVRENMHGVDVVMHTATLHKPHVATHARQDFVDTNITGTLTLLEAAREAGVSRFIFTSTTSVLGAALVPKESEPAAWITEDVRPVPKNIYGVTKAAAEDLCHLFHRTKGLPCVVLRTSRFFPELDDNPQRRLAFDDTNLKANEFLHRRLDVVDAVSAHLLAAESDLGGEFRTFILSATSPFEPEHLHDLRRDVHSVVAGLFPDYEMIYRRRGWKMYSSIDRVYVNAGAREVLGWQPHFSFRRVLDRLDAGEPILSNLAYEVGAKGYHTQTFADGPYPLEPDTAG
ncbi:MAG: NAD(P)-dependent oxidoreductase [Acidobacteriota bacterium]|nr:NAD(P)-dependent oxidoreductase [Acidobacteriota bacterium]